MSYSTPPESSPLPLRQSCDRCHGLKVRCIRNAEVGLETLPSESCSRCRRAGSVCIYSPQQKPGRPPLGSDAQDTATSASYARKRLRQSPPRTFRPSVGRPSDSATQRGSVSVDPAQFSPFMVGEELWLSNAPGYDLDFLTAVPNMPPIESSSSQSRSQAGPSEDEVSPASRPVQSEPEGSMKQSFADAIERDTEEIADLSLRIYRAVKAVSRPGQTLLSASSPALNDIFAASETFIGIVSRCISGCSGVNAATHLHNDDVSMFPTPPDWDDDCFSGSRHHGGMCSSAGKSADLGVVLMIVACHQRLLTAFWSILCSIAHQLRRCGQHKQTLFPPIDQQVRRSVNLSIGGGQTFSPPERQRSEDFQTNPFSFMEMPTTQALVVVKLVAHQLQRLNRALDQLVEYRAMMPVASATIPTALPRRLSSSSSGSSESPDLRGHSSHRRLRVGRGDENSELTSDGSTTDASTGCIRAIKAAMVMMNRDQDKVYAGIKTAKQLIRNLEAV
ncbi:hypothetical protein NA57DRAFT_56466 [Rhizodiscina lignyota]|uniref:Zn(2)-C6 fungal-type domain-containing protein n=1 Tax=Rhizodiscina lignyota TaxID=1504668 RepID=A0A9P4IGE6_9PEZI|nr:hypothetical protein NA57DRAFT_56466 [Rhizodiscina lignyota]